MKRINTSLTTRLYLSVLVITVILFAGIAIVFAAYSRQREQEETARYASLALQDLYHRIDNNLENVESAVITRTSVVASRMHSVDSMLNTVAHMATSNHLIIGASIAFVPDFFPERGHHFMVYAYLDSKNNLVRKIFDSEAYDYFNMDWYRGAMEGGKGRWSLPYYDGTGAEGLMTTYALPLRDSDGNIYAVITADMSLERFIAELNTLNPSPQSYSMVLSDNGTYLAHPNHNLLMKRTVFQEAQRRGAPDLIDVGTEMVSGHKGWRKTNLNGSVYMITYAPIPRTGWSIATLSPYRELLSALGSITYWLLLILAVGLIVLSISLHRVISRSLHPLDQLSKAAYKIASGDFNAPLPDPRDNSSISTLTEAFAHMQSSLTRYINNLTQATRNEERIRSELQIAHDIQRTMLPRTFPTYKERGEIDVHAAMIPATQGGGDFYDFTVNERKFHFCMGCLSISGISGSMLMTIVRSTFRSSVMSELSPSRIIENISDIITENAANSLRATIFIGSLDLDTGELVFSSASERSPMIIRNNIEESYLPSNGAFPLGTFEHASCTDSRIMLNPGDRLLLNSLGLIMAENSGGRHYDEEVLYHTVTILLAKEPTMSARKLVEGIMSSVREHISDTPQKSDIALMSISYRPNEQKEQ